MRREVPYNQSVVHSIKLNFPEISRVTESKCTRSVNRRGYENKNLDFMRTKRYSLGKIVIIILAEVLIMINCRVSDWKGSRSYSVFIQLLLLQVQLRVQLQAQVRAQAP
jgi:hypothetical protein